MNPELTDSDLPERRAYRAAAVSEAQDGREAEFGEAALRAWGAFHETYTRYQDEHPGVNPQAGVNAALRAAFDALSSAAAREDERERLAAAVRLCDEWEALAARQNDWNDDRRDRADAYGHAADALRAILAPSLAAPEGADPT